MSFLCGAGLSGQRDVRVQQAVRGAALETSRDWDARGCTGGASVCVGVGIIILIFYLFVYHAESGS